MVARIRNNPHGDGGDIMGFRGFSLALVLAAAAVGACTGDPADRGLGPQCAAGLDAGTRALEAAKLNGFSGTVKWGKAASLLSAAKIQEQFEEYQNCVIKTDRAQQYLRELPRS
jgi:hypothetical protein